MKNALVLILLSVFAPAAWSQIPTPAAPPATTPTPAPTPLPSVINFGGVQLNVPPVGAPEPAFMDAYPTLKNYIYSEASSGFYFGFGLSPIGFVRDRVLFAADFFQLHYLSDKWDYEVLNVSYGFTRASDSLYESDHFTFRTTPKYHVWGVFSAGPIIGYEFVSFPNINAKILKNSQISQDWEQFSTKGPIYGLMVTETLNYKTNYKIQINEVAYQQNYSTATTDQGWQYVYQNSQINSDQTKIRSGLVFAVEMSFLY